MKLTLTVRIITGTKESGIKFMNVSAVDRRYRLRENPVVTFEL